MAARAPTTRAPHVLLPKQLADDSFALRGRGHWTTRAPPQSNDDNAITLNYHAKNVYLVVGGAGTVTVTRDGRNTTVPVSGPPNMRQIVADDEVGPRSLEVSLSKGLQAFSFTYG